MTGSILTSSSSTQGAFRIAPTERIAHCGGLIIDVKKWTPYLPRFDIVKVPPSKSSSFKFFSLALETMIPLSDAISVRESL